MAACAHRMGTIAKRDGTGLVNLCACCGTRMYLVPIGALDDLYDDTGALMEHQDDPAWVALGEILAKFVAAVR